MRGNSEESREPRCGYCRKPVKVTGDDLVHAATGYAASWIPRLHLALLRETGGAP